MGMFYLGYILQGKIDKLIGAIEGVKLFSNEILVLSKERLSKNIDQIKVILSMLRNSGIRVNAPECSFELKDIPCTGYVITGEGIELDTKKLQGVM